MLEPFNFATAGRSLFRTINVFGRPKYSVQTQESSFLSLTNEQLSIRELAKSFCRQEIIPVATYHDRTGEYPIDVIKKAWKVGLLNKHVPKSCGGAELSSLSGCLVSEELAYGCSGIQTAMEANELAATPVIIAGNESQKKKYLSWLVDEPIVISYCVTEPGAGSDVAAIQTRARKVGNDWVLNGKKMWITNGGYASWFFVLARTGDSGARALSAFIVDGNSPGIVRGRKEMNMGQRASDTRGITFEDLTVPAANLLGAEGDGFKIAMQTFDKTRPPVAIAAVGVARRAIEEAIAYSKIRKTMGKFLFQHQAIGTLLADMAIGIESARSLSWMAANEHDCGRRNSYYASIAKALASEVAVSATSNAIQIFGGNGYNTDYPVEKLYRDAKIYQIYEGTTQIQKNIILKNLMEQTDGA